MKNKIEGWFDMAVDSDGLSYEKISSKIEAFSHKI